MNIAERRKVTLLVDELELKVSYFEERDRKAFLNRVHDLKKFVETAQ